MSVVRFRITSILDGQRPAAMQTERGKSEVGQLLGEWLQIAIVMSSLVVAWARRTQ
jgi:hypothetical protein